MRKISSLKEKLIAVAIEVIDQKGLADFSWRAVAKAAGVSHGAPARHFADKIVLLEAVAARGFVQLTDMCVNERQRFADDPRAQLRAVCRGYLDYARHHPGVIHLLAGGVLPWPAVGEELRGAGQVAFISFMEIIEQGQTSGIFQADETGHSADFEAVLPMAYAAWCTIHGLALFTSSGPLRSLHDNPEQFETLVTSVFDTLLRGMDKRTP